LENQLRALREAKGMTLDQLASAVGTTNQQISHLELGKRQLTVAWLTRLSDVLECHPWSIVGEPSPDPGPEERAFLARYRALDAKARADLLTRLQQLESRLSVGKTKAV
jgi:transcriptional regulator with XRE-family HTH domain